MAPGPLGWSWSDFKRSGPFRPITKAIKAIEFHWMKEKAFESSFFCVIRSYAVTVPNDRGVQKFSPMAIVLSDPALMPTAAIAGVFLLLLSQQGKRPS